MSEISLADWAVAVAAELGIEVDFDVDQVLDLASVAAHNVKRPAAPLTTFLAGFAAGQASGSAEDVVKAIEKTRALCGRAEDENEGRVDEGSVD